MKDIIKKSLLVGGVAGAVGMGSLASVGLASAASNTSGDTTLVDKIATTFHLNKNDVQKVFDEDRASHEAEHQAKVSERLQAMVDKGTITAEQKTAIEAKLQALKTEREANRDAFKDMTNSERKAKMDAMRTDLESWAKDQGLDLSKLRGIFMGGMHMGHGPGSGPGHMDGGQSLHDMQ